MRPVLPLALAAMGCASPLPPEAPAHAGDRLAAEPLLGPFPTLSKACSAAAATSGAPAAKACDAIAVAAPGAPFDVRILRADGATADPRFAGSGTFFLAVGKDGAWFAQPKILDRMDGAAGHMYLPTVAPAKVAIVPRDGRARVVLELRDDTVSMCNACEGSRRDERRPVRTRKLVVVCDEGTIEPSCTAPVEGDADAQVAFDGKVLTVGRPGAVKRYVVAP